MYELKRDDKNIPVCKVFLYSVLKIGEGRMRELRKKWKKGSLLVTIGENMEIKKKSLTDEVKASDGPLLGRTLAFWLTTRFAREIPTFNPVKCHCWPGLWLFDLQHGVPE